TLVVDPFPDTNPKKVFRGGPEYVVERYWVPYAVDPRWHTLNHAAGLCGDDVGLNNFQPKFFGISGKFQTAGNDPVNVFDAPPITDPSVAITAPSGTPILIRFLNGQYFPVDIDFGGILVQPVSSDGRAFLVDPCAERVAVARRGDGREVRVAIRIGHCHAAAGAREWARRRVALPGRERDVERRRRVRSPPVQDDAMGDAVSVLERDDETVRSREHARCEYRTVDRDGRDVRWCGSPCRGEANGRAQQEQSAERGGDRRLAHADV